MLKASHWVFLALVSLVEFTGSVGLQIPGWERAPIHGEEDGNPAALVKVFEDVFDEAFLKVLETEAEPMSYAASNLGTLRNGKRATFYMPTSDPNRKPRCASEQAILLLKELIYPNGIDRKLGIKGAKYWFQHRTSSEDVGFHFDKDEGTASDQQIMKFPYINTLLYLTDEGAPTIFFNQTVVNNGNLRYPYVPEEGWLVYPKRNKFCLQRGDLLHGAAASMAVDEVGSQSHRTTFVLSFEDETPVEPNCHELTDDEMPKEAKANLAKWGKHWDSLNSDITVVDPTPMPLTKLLSKGGETENRVIDAGIGMEHLHMSLPKTIEGKTTYYATWGEGQLWSELALLELENERMMERVWESRTPVSILFEKEHAQGNQQAHRINAIASQNLIRTHVTRQVGNAQRLSSPISFYRCQSVADCEDAMESFGVEEADLPMVVVHYTQTDQKYKMEPRDLPLTAESLHAFYEAVLAGKREPLPEDGEDGGEL